MKDSQVTIELVNSSWRYVDVYRKDISESGKNTVLTVYDNMKGAVPISWGSLFTKTIADPTKINDNNY